MGLRGRVRGFVRMGGAVNLKMCVGESGGGVVCIGVKELCG